MALRIQNKPKEELVLSHGDLCHPNIFINGGKISSSAFPQFHYLHLPTQEIQLKLG